MGKSPLHAACHSFLSGNDPFPCVQLLLNKRADPNKLDNYGCTPLFMLVGGFTQTTPITQVNVQKALAKTVRLLLIKGADRNI